ncbi:UNVERIFIED_ORG: hypothetical protein LHK14_12975 [Roseateles sp. XES5]|nr:hypothetical protein [Roseateles sp. XES5]
MLLVAVAGAQAFADAMRDLQEFRRLADVERAFLRQGDSMMSVTRPGRGLMTTIFVER